MIEIKVLIQQNPNGSMHYEVLEQKVAPVTDAENDLFARMSLALDAAVVSHIRAEGGGIVHETRSEGEGMAPSPKTPPSLES